MRRFIFLFAILFPAVIWSSPSAEGEQHVSFARWIREFTLRSSLVSTPTPFSSSSTSFRARAAPVFKMFGRHDGRSWSPFMMTDTMFREHAQRGTPTCEEMHEVIFKPQAYETVMWNVSQIPFDRVCGYSAPSWAERSSICIAKGTAQNSFVVYTKEREQELCCCENRCLILSFRVQECTVCSTFYIRLLLIKSPRPSNTFNMLCSASPSPSVQISSSPSMTPTPWQCTQPTETALYTPSGPGAIPSGAVPSPTFLASKQPPVPTPVPTPTGSPTPRAGIFTPSRQPIAAIIIIIPTARSRYAIINQAFKKWRTDSRTWIPFWKYTSHVKKIDGKRYRVIFRFKEKFAKQWV